MGYRGGSSSTPTFASLSGVTLSSPASGQVLKYSFGQWRNSDPAFAQVTVGGTGPMVLDDDGLRTLGRGIDLSPPAGTPVNLPAGHPEWFSLEYFNDSYFTPDMFPMLLEWNDVNRRYEFVNIQEGTYGEPPYEYPWRGTRSLFFSPILGTNTFTILRQYVAEEPTGSPVYTDSNDYTPSAWNGSDYVPAPPYWTGSGWSLLPFDWYLGTYGPPGGSPPVLDMGGNGLIENARNVTTERLRVTSVNPPVPTSLGEPGELRWDGSYLYVCVAYDTWKRVAITSWTP